MDSQYKVTTEHWQYYVGQTIHPYLHACTQVGETSSKLAQVTKLKLAVGGKEGMAS